MMHLKLAALHQQFKSAQEGLTIEATSLTPEVSTSICEILSIFGLPPSAEFIEILIEFGKSEDCTDAVIDAALIRLAAEGTFYQTLVKLSV